MELLVLMVVLDSIFLRTHYVDSYSGHSHSLTFPSGNSRRSDFPMFTSTPFSLKQNKKSLILTSVKGERLNTKPFF